MTVILVIIGFLALMLFLAWLADGPSPVESSSSKPLLSIRGHTRDELLKKLESRRAFALPLRATSEPDRTLSDVAAVAADECNVSLRTTVPIPPSERASAVVRGVTQLLRRVPVSESIDVAALVGNASPAASLHDIDVHNFWVALEQGRRLPDIVYDATNYAPTPGDWIAMLGTSQRLVALGERTRTLAARVSPLGAWDFASRARFALKLDPEFLDDGYRIQRLVDRFRHRRQRKQDGSYETYWELDGARNPLRAPSPRPDRRSASEIEGRASLLAGRGRLEHLLGGPAWPEKTSPADLLSLLSPTLWPLHDRCARELVAQLMKNAPAPVLEAVLALIDERFDDRDCEDGRAHLVLATAEQASLRLTGEAAPARLGRIRSAYASLREDVSRGAISNDRLLARLRDFQMGTTDPRCKEWAFLLRTSALGGSGAFVFPPPNRWGSAVTEHEAELYAPAANWVGEDRPIVMGVPPDAWPDPHAHLWDILDQRTIADGFAYDREARTFKAAPGVDQEALRDALWRACAEATKRSLREWGLGVADPAQPDVCVGRVDGIEYRASFQNQDKSWAAILPRSCASYYDEYEEENRS